ncbi:hypothetical protein N7922_01580 [Kosakonia sp. ML.JS2a]|uniref:COG4648 family protein n=1 Tax=Kosakonia sp. ML.JS2a TaxID=2980557 RepID=UPI0021D94DBE|nr:hypothetical protein [Kosakonia sp. ML.JS2a]UXY11247.1 hypothetical protein N7922_01580 [Kosakonia sp. ML.JS2a]
MRGSRLQSGLRLVAALLMLSWPFVVWFGLTHNSLHWLLPLMALMLLFRLRQARQAIAPLRAVSGGVAVVGIALCAASWLLKTHQLLLYYPVAVNLIMLAVFGGSLKTAMPLVERLARLREPQLPAAAVRYTRRVTQIWCIFFVLNGGIALFTALYGDMRLWTAWNGMIAYLLMGALMAGEWLVRRQVIKRETT